MVGKSNSSPTSDSILEVFVGGEGVRLDDIYGKAIAILGVRGSGKTNTAAVFVEELLAKGVPVIVLDIDGEYWTLRESYDILIVSADERADIPLNIGDNLQAEKLARALLSTYIPAVIDLSEFIVNEYSNYLVGFLGEIWRSSKLYRRPLFVVVEEAHEFIPQGYSTPVKNLLVRIALRGRKRGLGLIMVSQRSAKVDKDVLSQAEYYVLHKVMHPADLRVYKDLLPLNPREIEAIVPKLGVGEALFYDGSTVKEVRVRKRRTFHMGFTPKTSTKTSFRLRSIDRALLDRVLSIIGSQTSKSLTGSSGPDRRDSPIGGASAGRGSGAVGPRRGEDSLYTAIHRALEVIVEIVSVLARMSPSTVTHVYVLARERGWLSYSELREASGFKAVNARELRRLERLGIIELERHGREMFVRQSFLTGDSSIDRAIVEALRLLYDERARPLLERVRRQAASNDKGGPSKPRRLGSVVDAL